MKIDLNKTVSTLILLIGHGFFFLNLSDHLAFAFISIISTFLIWIIWNKTTGTFQLNTLLTLIAFFVSLYLLYKFNDYGRQLFIFTNILAILFVFSDGYVVFDSFDYFLDSISTALIGFTIAISYFSNLSKEFKKKK